MLLKLLTLSIVCNAKQITVSLDEVHWFYKGDRFFCSLNQNSKNFGDVTFIARPNEVLTLTVQLQQVSNVVLNSEVYQVRSPWGSDREIAVVATGKVSQKKHVSFQHETAIDGLLFGLSQGSWLGFSFQTQAQVEPIYYVIPMVGSIGAINDFQQCRAKLPNLSYKQARDMVFQFKSGQRVADPSQKRQIANLAEYIKLDKNVKEVLVDGHTDSVGNALANLNISRERADDIASLLQEFGVAKRLIEVRAHGARYPLISNSTPAGRDKNRRVTVRIIKDGTKG